MQGRGGEAWVYLGLGADGWPALLGSYLALRTWAAGQVWEHVPDQGSRYHAGHNRRLAHGMGTVPFR